MIAATVAARSPATRCAIANTIRQISTNTNACAIATGSVPLAEQAIDHGDERRVAGRANHFGDEDRRVGKARELAAPRHRGAELLVAALIAPRDLPVRPLIDDEERRVRERDQRRAASEGAARSFGVK